MTTKAPTPHTTAEHLQVAIDDCNKRIAAHEATIVDRTDRIAMERTHRDLLQAILEVDTQTQGGS